MEPVSFGVLGASGFALKHTARAIHEAEGARFAALATSDPAKAEPFAAFAPGLTVHGSYDDLLADPAIEAVYIPLPNHLHVQWALRAVEAGKHVLCEKPIAMRAEEIDALIDAQGRQRAVRHRGVHDRAPPAGQAGPAPDRRGRDRHPAARGHRADLRRR